MLPPYIVGLIKLWSILRPFLKENFMGKGQLGGWFKEHVAFATLFGCVSILSLVCFFLMDQLNAFYSAKERENAEVVLLRTKLTHTEDKVIILTNVIRALNKQPMLDMPEHGPPDPSVTPGSQLERPVDPTPEPQSESSPITIRTRLDELAAEDYS